MDPLQTLGDFVSSLNDSVQQYTEQVEVYLEQANQTATVNMIGDSVINAVSTLLCDYNYLICEHLKECVLVAFLVPSQQTDH